MDQTTEFITSELFTIVQEKLNGSTNVYMVGGAIRDVLLTRPIHDMDFVVIGNAGKVAKKLADELQGGFYMLDEERDIARVVLNQKHGKKFYLDFSSLRDENLFKDLSARDFTINAMALNMAQPEQIIDPLKGLKDIKAGYLQICNPGSFHDDPIRVIRAVRMAVQFNLKITDNTLVALKAEIENLNKVSQERIRDELFRMLESDNVATAIRLLDHLKILKTIWPELAALKNVKQGDKHCSDVWDHTLATVQGLEDLLQVLVGEFDQNGPENYITGIAAASLGRYRENLENHFQQSLNTLRSRRGLLFYAALYHDCGKPAVAPLNGDEKNDFIGHDMLAGSMVRDAARKLRLSENEVDAVNLMVKEHMQLHILGLDGKTPTRREIHQFFKRNRSFGVDLTLLFLADLIGKYQHTLPQDVWQEKVNQARVFLQAYFDEFDEVINPPKLVSGAEIMKEFHIAAGPQVGTILEEVQARQAEGSITTRAQAMSCVKNLLKEKTA